jgi:hypothetical protein
MGLGNSDQALVPLGPRWGSGTETWQPLTFPGWAALACGTIGVYRVGISTYVRSAWFRDPFFLSQVSSDPCVGEAMGVHLELPRALFGFHPPRPGFPFNPAVFTHHAGHTREVSCTVHALMMMNTLHRTGGARECSNSSDWALRFSWFSQSDLYLCF